VLPPDRRQRDLIGGELLARKRGREWPRLRWEQAGVGRKVELGSVTAVLDHQPDEAWVHPDRLNAEASVAKRSHCCRSEAVDIARGESEEVKISCAPIYVPAQDHRASTSEGEALRFIEAGDDGCDLLL